MVKSSEFRCFVPQRSKSVNISCGAPQRPNWSFPHQYISSNCSKQSNFGFFWFYLNFEFFWFFSARAGAQEFHFSEKKKIINVKMKPSPTRYFYNILWAPSDRLEVTSQKFVATPMRYRGVSELIFQIFEVFRISSARERALEATFLLKNWKFWNLETKSWEQPERLSSEIICFEDLQMVNM